MCIRDRVRVQPRGGLNLLRLFSVAAPAFALMFSFFMKREWNTALKTALIIFAVTEATVTLPFRARRSCF